MSLIYKELDEDVLSRINAIFPKKDTFIDVQPGHTIIPRKYAEIGESIRALPTYKDDIWLVSYPRAGSTRAQELIWQLGHNLECKIEKTHIVERVPIIELSALWSEDHTSWVNDKIGNTVDAVRNLTRPRFARSHLPWNLLPQAFDTIKPKIIYIARNPKDLCVSLFHHLHEFHGMQSTFSNFAELFLADDVPIGPYWRHVLPFWKRSHDPNMLFLKYEDMNSNLASTVRKCARFLDVDDLLTEENMERICKHLRFDCMRINTALNMVSVLKIENNKSVDVDCIEQGKKFIRKGQTGDWKNYMDDDLSKRFDEWIERNSRGSGLVFDYE